MFSSVLVANRGEIAVRIIRTLRAMGIRSVLAASVPDRRSMAARSADEVVVLEGYSAAETYLDIELVVAAAKRSGCAAVHPGYGFLSERADFAERCAAEGLVFVGPPPGVLRALGDKSAARELAVNAGVPAVPGYDGPDDDATLAAAANELGFPLMIKARGGGGGRGMREVHDASAFPEAVELARRESQAAFGDSRLLLEKLVIGAHHVEVQILADAHGNTLHLGERDCSVQRRRQKLIEESPSPVVDGALRVGLTDAALRIARAANFVNAGTVEFLVGAPGEDGERRVYFLEVNPRLQVEHPVTEMRTGVDLVEMQLRIAAGDRLLMAQEEVQFSGYAIEFRINAEDPWAGFLPSSGRLRYFSVGCSRFDTGYEATAGTPGDTVPSQYDSLLAKAVFFGETRSGALEQAQRSLRSDRPSGLRLNTELLRRVAGEPVFIAGAATTGWLENNLDEILAEPATPQRHWDEALRLIAERGVSAWLGAGDRQHWLSDGHETRAVVLSPDRAPHGSARRRSGDGLWAEFSSFDTLRVYEDTGNQPVAQFRFVPPPDLPRRSAVEARGGAAVAAPLAGTIADVRVAEGDSIDAGQLLLLLDAMKMEHRIVATAAGTVTSVLVKPGDVVREGDVLVELS